eukprot:986573-Heterocapsa_arctica.AAC.1
MTIHSKSGASYDFWIECLNNLIRDNEALMSMDLDGVRRFPISVPCVIIDNLNVLYTAGNMKFTGMSTAEWDKERTMFVLMGRFRSRFYMCSASASRW